ncbi:urease accessory protein UreE [Congregibacter variabilis]|uniref:Urease accessory protein UreE n=1 Tax=Congregibacter variabilis TaxID=3081200 RepID=A0ABZ0I4K1_9GAMM|nr:urease accessory protein UreE [Congregibacter sp. IMCC43200]
MDELMLEAYHHATAFDGAWQDEVHLVFSEREKSRYRTTTERGQELGWFLPRGIVLSDGDALLCDNKEIVLIRAANESLTEAYSDDPHLLLRAAYHLGNRHVNLQILAGALRFPRDHVLEDMLKGLGIGVRAIDDAFTPESGAYASVPREHADAHSHGHTHSHSHSHTHS